MSVIEFYFDQRGSKVSMRCCVVSTNPLQPPCATVAMVTATNSIATATAAAAVVLLHSASPARVERCWSGDVCVLDFDMRASVFALIAAGLSRQAEKSH